jgi:hypothetical protein
VSGLADPSRQILLLLARGGLLASLNAITTIKSFKRSLIQTVKPLKTSSESIITSNTFIQSKCRRV